MADQPVLCYRCSSEMRPDHDTNGARVWCPNPHCPAVGAKVLPENCLTSLPPGTTVAPLVPNKCFADDLDTVLTELRTMLIEKNTAYGDSALNPVRTFSKASNVEQLLVRIDDKLSRLARGSTAGEDVEKDLLGYLVILRIARKRGEG